jgi:hypothetical protein
MIQIFNSLSGLDIEISLEPGLMNCLDAGEYSLDGGLEISLETGFEYSLEPGLEFSLDC